MQLKHPWGPAVMEGGGCVGSWLLKAQGTRGRCGKVLPTCGLIAVSSCPSSWHLSTCYVMPTPSGPAADLPWVMHGAQEPRTQVLCPLHTQVLLFIYIFRLVFSLEYSRLTMC